MNINHSENIGKQYGRLTVLSVLKDGKYFRYECKCVCGNTVRPLSWNILKQDTTSCGCYQQEVARQKRGKSSFRKTDGESAFNTMWLYYLRNAEQRGYVFELSRDQFKKLTKGKCYFCGIEPNSTKFNRSKTEPYICNGVDRLDNNLDYTKENTVSCCTTCNVAKNTMSVQEFKTWITRVYKSIYG